MEGIRSIVEGYFAVWNETDPTRRRDLITRTWSENASYRDPVLTADGHQGIDVMVATVHEQFPKHQFRLAGPIDSHHDCLRFNWELASVETGTAAIAGVDFGVLAADGRLKAITGFLDQVPEPQDAPVATGSAHAPGMDGAT